MVVMRAIDEDASDDDDNVELEELAGFAEHLGLSLPAEQDLMWICKMALNAPVPAGWTPHNDGAGNTYYYNAETGASSWDHPSDPYFRTLLRRCRRLKMSASKGFQGSQAAIKANEDLNGQLDKLKDKYTQLKNAAAKVGQENDAMAEVCVVRCRMCEMLENLWNGFYVFAPHTLFLHVHVCVHTRTLHACTRTRKHTYTHIHTRTCTHTRTRTHTSIQIQSHKHTNTITHTHMCGYQ